MKRFYLKAVKEVRDANGKKIKLEYYLIQEERNLEGSVPLYGIRIVKTVRGNGKIIREKETADALSYSENDVENIILKLVKNFVMPSTMINVIDEMVC